MIGYKKNFFFFFLQYLTCSKSEKKSKVNIFESYKFGNFRKAHSKNENFQLNIILFYIYNFQKKIFFCLDFI